MKNPVFQAIARLEQHCDAMSGHLEGNDMREQLARRLEGIANGIREGDRNWASIAIVTDQFMVKKRKSSEELPSWVDVVALERFDLTPANYRESRILISPSETKERTQPLCAGRVIDMVGHMEKLTEAFLDGVVDHPDLKESQTETVTTISKASI